ncbi:sulfotransferase family protein [Cognatiyoonia sp.]|uniref:sulfotransferase-like domain-containing protein n=1 Tax=Cognatiyoonia sp. TaxID=2211652 RepID=UPI003F6A3CA9
MHRILALWAVPRSTSTAFEWMMRQRGDFDCLHEPFGEAWYQGEAPIWPRWKPGDKVTPGLTLQSTLEDILDRATRAPVFIKDFPHYIIHMADKDFLAHFEHAFLIRDPAKTITSMYDKWPDFNEGEVGFAEQRALFDKITLLNGRRPPVIDSDDLLEDPHTMVERWCESVEIPFIESALSWEPGARDEVSWWDGGSFHANLRNSDGLKPQVRKYVELDATPERVRDVHSRARPNYDHLYQFRTQP